MFLYRRKSRSISPRHRRSRSPPRRHKSRSQTPRNYKRQRSRSSSLSPIRKSSSSSLGSIERKNASEKLRIEEEEKKRYINYITYAFGLVMCTSIISISYNIVIWVMDGKILAWTVIVFSPEGFYSMEMMH